MGRQLRLFRTGQQFDDALQGLTGRLEILSEFQMPIGKLVQSGRNILRGVTRLMAKALDRNLRAGKVVEVFRLDFGKHDLSCDIIWKFSELLVDGEDRKFPNDVTGQVM